MKKFLATVIALSAITAAFTGCTGNGDSSSGSSGASGASGTSDTDSSSPASGTTSDAGASDSSSSEARTAADLGMAASTCIDWGDLEQVEDAEIVKSMLGIDLSLCEESYVATAMMNVHLSEVIVLKPSEGNEDAVKSQLDEHFAYIKDGAAFYPEQEAAAAGAVQGETEDGFYYIIVHQIGSEIADVMTAHKRGDEIPKLEVPEDEMPGDDGVVIVPTDELEPPIYFGEGDSQTAQDNGTY